MVSLWGRAPKALIGYGKTQQVSGMTMSFIPTLLLTLLLVAGALWVFIKIGSPVYRVEKINIIRLLELVIAGRATAKDWDVFIGVPIRHSPELDAIRKRCQRIADRELLGGDGEHLFTRRGIAELRAVLDELKTKATVDS